jgi:hypothetical protein
MNKTYLLRNIISIVIIVTGMIIFNNVKQLTNEVPIIDSNSFIVNHSQIPDSL